MNVKNEEILMTPKSADELQTTLETVNALVEFINLSFDRGRSLWTCRHAVLARQQLCGMARQQIGCL